MTDAKCPLCKADLQWMGGTSASPASVASVYRCPDPTCTVTVLQMVVEE